MLVADNGSALVIEREELSCLPFCSATLISSGCERTMSDKSTVERAFELAREGSCRSVADIRKQLAAERYESVQAHLTGTAIVGQLKALLKARSD